MLGLPLSDLLDLDICIAKKSILHLCIPILCGHGCFIFLFNDSIVCFGVVIRVPAVNAVGLRSSLDPPMSIYANCAVLACTDERITIDIDPKADALVATPTSSAFNALHHLLALDVPHDDTAILRGGGDKRLAVNGAEAPSYAKAFVHMSLVRLLDGA